MKGFYKYLNYIPANSLKSICDEEILEQNRLQKSLLINFQTHQENHYHQFDQFVKTYDDAREVDFVNQKLKECKEILKESENCGYHETWNLSLKRYVNFLEQKLLLLTDQSDMARIAHPHLNNQELIFLYLWKYKNGLMHFKNESQLASFLQTQCSYGQGKKPTSVRSVISRIKSCDIDMKYMMDKLQNQYMNFDFIDW